MYRLHENLSLKCSTNCATHRHDAGYLRFLKAIPKGLRLSDSSCCFVHRESGIVIKDTDISIGEISVNLNEESLQKNKTPSAVTPDITVEANVSAVASDKASDSTVSAITIDTVSESSVNNVPANDATKKEAVSPMSKLSRIFPEKVGLSTLG